MTVSASLLGLLVACLAATPAASALVVKPPHYTLSIVEGETTQPEFGIAHTSGSVDRSKTEVVVSIVRAGVVVARNSHDEGVWLSQVPNVGDVVNLESPAGTVVGAVVYDGLPSLDPTVCAGSANFSGQRSAGQTVGGGYFSLILKSDPYGHTSLHETASGQAQVTVLSGSAYAGSFLVALAIGQTVLATESLETPLAGGAVFTYESENDRPVGACPVPPPPPSPPPAPALQGSIFKLLHTTISRLLKFGWHNQVTINQPGTVTQDLYLLGGTLPAFASSAKAKHHRKPPALLLARGSATAKAAGKVVVVVKATARGRHKLKGAKQLHAVLITTLRSTSGAKLNLGRRSVTLHR